MPSQHFALVSLMSRRITLCVLAAERLAGICLRRFFKQFPVNRFVAVLVQLCTQYETRY
jgi:hypothetical protein